MCLSPFLLVELPLETVVVSLLLLLGAVDVTDVAEFPVLHQAARGMASFPCCFPKRYCGPSSAVIVFDLRLVNTTTNALYLPVLLSKVFHFRPTLLPCLFVAFFA